MKTRRAVLLAVVRRIFRVTLRGWPSALRNEMESEVLHCFELMSEETLARAGVPGLVALTVRSVVDLVVTGARERRNGRRDRSLRSVRGRTAKGSTWGPATSRSDWRRVMDVVVESARGAFRSLIRGKGSSLVVVVTLGVGIGVNAALLDLGYRALWRPLPFSEPEQLVSLYETEEDAPGQRGRVSPANFEDWRASSSSLQAMAAFAETSVNFTGDGEPERLVVYRSSAELLSLLGVEPFLGRFFRAEEDRDGGPRVAVLAYRLWERRFGASPAAVGRTLLLDDVPHEIIGVLPPTLAFPSRRAELFLPLALSEEERTTRRSHYLDVVGRLAAGVPLERARDEMHAIARHLAEAFPANEGETVALVPLQEDLVGGARKAILLVLGAVVAVLLIACVNVSNLLLARASSRRREVSLRAALGASRLRLMGQFLAEAMALAMLGGFVGVLLRSWVTEVFDALAPAHLAPAIAKSVSGELWTLALALAVGGIVGSLPAFQLSRANLSLLEGGAGVRGTSSKAKGLVTRRTLVVVEVALALVLLLAAGVMIRSFLRLRGENPGFSPQRVLTMRIELSRTRYAGHETKVSFLRELLGRVEHHPSVVSAGFVTMAPLTFSGGSTVFVPEDLPDAEENRVAFFRSTTPNYFRAIGAQLMSGRTFGEGDTSRTEKLVVVNEAFAREFYAGEALERRIGIWGEPHTIVGIVGDIRETGLRRPPEPTMYVSAYQRGFGFFDPRDLVIRARGNPESIVESVRAEVWAIDPDQPVSAIRTMEAIVEASVSDERLQTFALVFFAAAALLLAALGIYGVLAYAVSQRTSEIGLRMAFGARGPDVLRLVLAQGMAPVVLGLVIGLLGAFSLSRFLSSFLYGVEATELAPVLLITSLLAVVALLACLLPSIRAIRVDPLVALREE